ncbi:hypothetical protein EGW08_016729 [Elysia chlorotica]|uniref:Uncharacterized protein n=1 Tax=Elysia chlorotica TaxID=188477 RepID=A0A433T1V8_ELYCH|nr:hypothetical protein EGW08_016729 [Elysia chlorotica]
MERPRFVHFAKLGSARTIYPRSSPASPASPCGAFGVAMAPLASSEPDISGAGIKANTSIVQNTPVPTPRPSSSRVTLLREPVRRSGSTSSHRDPDREGQSPLVTGASTIPRYTEPRSQRYDKSASSNDNIPRRFQKQNASTSSNTCIRSSVSSNELVFEDKQISPKRKEFSSHSHISKLAPPSSKAPVSLSSTTKARPPGNASAQGTRVCLNEGQKQRLSKTSESAIPRGANTRPAVYNQVANNIESPTHPECQSSPLQIRRVLRSSPAFAQFYPKNKLSENDRNLSRIGRQNTTSPGQSNGVQKHLHPTRTSSETSLASAGGSQVASSLPVSRVPINVPKCSNQPRRQSTEVTSSHALNLSRKQETSQKARPSHLTLNNEIVTRPDDRSTPTSQSARRIPQPSGHQLQASSASTPSNLPRSKTGSSSQTPTKLKSKYYQRHADTTRKSAYPVEEESKRTCTPNSGTPRKYTTEKFNEPKKNKTLCSPNTSNESLSSENSQTKYSSKGQTHKQGFGFGYTCTANASIKRKQSSAKTTPKQQVRPAIPRASETKSGQYSDKSSSKSLSSKSQNDFIESQEEPDQSIDPNAFQSTWKRNSMRLATQGYSSMSDLTKSIDCLILGPNSQLSITDSVDIEGNSLMSSGSCSSQNTTLSRNGVVENVHSKDNGCNRNDGVYQEDHYNSIKSPPSSTSGTTSLHSRIPSSSSAFDSKSSSQRPKMQSGGIPIKQAYFANNSFILVPGVPGETCDGEIPVMNYSSPSGSPSSGYSSSPAARDRRPNTKLDNYYEQQEHQNKIKRRSFVLATSSISDLSYFLDDVDTPVPPLKEKIGNFPSFVTLNEAFSTPDFQRRQPDSLTSTGSGPLNSSFGSFYSCRSQSTSSQKLSPPSLSKDSEDKRGSFYDNCQESPKQTNRRQTGKDGYESEESSTESEYKTASSSSFVGRKDLNPAARDDHIRAKLLSRHWVRTTPYRHSRFNPDQALSNYNRYGAQPSLPGRQDQPSPQSSLKENLREMVSDLNQKSKENHKFTKKSPSPTDSRKVPKKRVTSPIAWCTSSRTTERKRGKSPSVERKRSNSSPFPNGRLSPSKSHDLSGSTTSPAIAQNQNGASVQNRTYRCQAEAQYSSDFRDAQSLSSKSDSIDDDQMEFFDTESDDRWMGQPRAPPSLGRPRRKEYAGFDSQPLPMDSFVSDSSSVYTDNTSMCSSRAPSRSADVESYSRRSSVASSTREFAACSRAFSSGASGALTPRRQMSDDTICNDISYQLGSFHHREDDASYDAGDITLSNMFICEDTLPDSKRSSKLSASFHSKESVRATEFLDSSVQLRGCVSSQSQTPLNGLTAVVDLPTKAHSCFVGRRTSDASSRKSSTSGVSSDSYAEEPHADCQSQQHQQQQQQQQQKPLKGTRFCERVRGLT